MPRLPRLLKYLYQRNTFHLSLRVWRGINGLQPKSKVTSVTSTEYIDKRTLPTGDERAQTVLHLMKSFAIIDNCLHFVDPNTAELRLVVPEKYQHLLFHERHAGVFGVHYCGRKIFLALKKKYYWPNMRGDCERWARRCPICAFTREPRLNLPPLLPIVASAPFDLVCMDILQLGLTPRGKKYLLVCVDHFSKFLVAEPLATKSAKKLLQCFSTEWSWCMALLNEFTRTRVESSSTMW